MKTKYIAIKVKGFHHYIWFERAKTSIKKGIFIGEAGWGDEGEFTNIKVKKSDITGEIESNKLQYLS